MTKLTNVSLNTSLLDRLNQADVVCVDCGKTYGKYSVGCSSFWKGECDVCGMSTSVTEVRDFGYLKRGIDMVLKGEDIEEPETPAYEKGEIVLQLTEDEVGFLHGFCLDTLADIMGDPGADPEDVALFKSIEKKITELYEYNCIKYELSPALKAYYDIYGEYGLGEYQMRWEGFRDAFNLALESK